MCAGIEWDSCYATSVFWLIIWLNQSILVNSFFLPIKLKIFRWGQCDIVISARDCLAYIHQNYWLHEFMLLDPMVGCLDIIV